MVVYKTELPPLYDSYIKSETLVWCDFCPKVSVIDLIFFMYQMDLQFWPIFSEVHLSHISLYNSYDPSSEGSFFQSQIVTVLSLKNI